MEDKVNFNMFLNRLRWDTVYDKFEEMSRFKIDAIQYAFKYPLSKSEQMDFIEFIGDSDHLNSLTPVDFCNFLLNRKIEFTVTFCYTRRLSFKKNMSCRNIVKMLNNKLTRTEYDRWHQIRDDDGYPAETKNCIIQTQDDVNQMTCREAKFLAPEKRFIAKDNDSLTFDNVLYWRNMPKETTA